MKDYYKVLGVPRNATADRIRQAYRKLVRACHPDVNSSPKAAEWARELNEAYDTLGNTEARVSYDMDLRLDESKQREGNARKTRGKRHRIRLTAKVNRHRNPSQISVANDAAE